MRIHRFMLAPAVLSLTACASSIVNNAANECANLPWHGFPMDGTTVRMIPCVGRPGEAWNLKNGQITGVGGSCMDVEGSNALQGAHVISVGCNGSPSQQWYLKGTQIVGVGGMCLDVGRGGEESSPPLVINPCSGAPTQQWSIH